MKTGVSFQFNHFSILQFAECFMQDEFPSFYEAGQMEVRDHEKSLGVAGQLDQEIINAIPHGTELSIVADFNKVQQNKLVAAVEHINAEINFRARHSAAYNTLNVVSPELVS